MMEQGKQIWERDNGKSCPSLQACHHSIESGKGRDLEPDSSPCFNLRVTVLINIARGLFLLLAWSMRTQRAAHNVCIFMDLVTGLLLLYPISTMAQTQTGPSGQKKSVELGLGLDQCLDRTRPTLSLPASDRPHGYSVIA